MRKSRFTRNKQVVRDIQCELIGKRFKTRVGTLRYFGLSSDEMEDVELWDPLFKEFVTVERGDKSSPWRAQHDLIVRAFQIGVLPKTTLLRGDIDRIVLNGRDDDNNVLVYPFDVVSLDYSGGLLYDEDGEKTRLSAIKKLVEDQAKHRIEYLLFISCNLDNPNDGELQRSIETIKTEYTRLGYSSTEVFEKYLRSPFEEARLKLYVPHFVNQIAANCRYSCESEKVVFYLGNKQTRMMNFRFYLRFDSHTFSPRFPRERFRQTINSPMIEVKNGIQKNVTLGLPKLQ